MIPGFFDEKKDEQQGVKRSDAGVDVGVSTGRSGMSNVIVATEKKAERNENLRVGKRATMEGGVDQMTAGKARRGCAIRARQGVV